MKIKHLKDTPNIDNIASQTYMCDSGDSGGSDRFVALLTDTGGDPLRIFRGSNLTSAQYGDTGLRAFVAQCPASGNSTFWETFKRKINTTGGAGNQSLDWITLGSSYDQSGQAYDGFLHQVLVWDRLVSDDEVEAILDGLLAKFR